MSLFSLLKIVGAPVARLGSKALQKGSLPLAGLDLFEMQRASRGAVEQAMEGDKTGTAAQGLAAYGSTILAPQTIDYAVKNNPKIMKTLDVVTPKKFKTGYTLLKQGIKKLPLSKTAEKYPFRTALGVFTPAAVAEPIRDAIFPEAEAAPLRTPVKVEEENILNTANLRPAPETLVEEETETDSVADNTQSPTNNQIEEQQVDQDVNTEQADDVITAAVNQDSQIQNNLIDTDNINSDGVPLLQGNSVLGGNTPSSDGATIVPKDIQELALGLEKSIMGALPASEKGTVTLLQNSQKIQNRILEEKFKLLQERKDILKSQQEGFLDFDEFYKKFNQMAGRDVPDASKDFILLKLGLNMMSGRTDQQGFAGFLDIAGRAGVTAVDELQKLYELEKNKRESMALKYLDYEDTMKNHLDTQKIEILNAKSGFLDAYINNKTNTIEKLLEFKGEYYNALAEKQKLEQEAYAAKYKVNDSSIRQARINNPGALFGFDYATIGNSDGPGAELMIFYTNEKGENKFGTFNDMKQDLSNKINKIQNSNYDKKVKEAMLAELSTGLLEANPMQLQRSDVQPLDVNKYAKNISRTKTLLEATAMLNNVQQIAAGALQKGVPVLGFKGGLFNILSNVKALFKDVTNADIEKQIALLNQGDLPDDDVMLGGLKSIQEYELKDGTVLKGQEAQTKVLEKYYKELGDAGKGVSRKMLDQIKEQIGDDKFDTLSAEQQQELFTAIEIAQVQLKYALANSFKGEDRLTEKNLQEFGALTRFVGGGRSTASVIQRLKQLNVLALKRLNYETRVLKKAGASDQDLKDILEEIPFNLLLDNYKASRGIFDEPGAKDITLQDLQSISKGITD